MTLPAIALALALAGSLAPAARAGAEPLGLIECLEMVRAGSPQVRQTPELKNWEQEKVSAAKRRFLPRVDVDLYHQPTVDFFGRPITDHDTFTSEFKVTQPVYTSGALTASRDKAQQGVAKAELQTAKASLDSAVEAVPSYYRLLTYREVAALRQDLAPRAAELVEAARQGVKLGVLRQEDLLAAEARSLEVSYQVAESTSQAKSAGFLLKELLGLPRDQVLEVRPQIPTFYPSDDAEALVEKAMNNNANLRYAKAEDQYQSLGLSLAQAAEGPRFNVIGRYGLQGDDFPGPDKYAGVMLQCDISFGDSSAKAFYDFERQFVNQAAFYFEREDLYRKGLRLSFLDGSSPAVSEAEARYQRYKAREELRDARLRLRADLLSSLEELRRYEELLSLAAKQRDLYEERLEVARGKVAAGAATPVEVLEREVDLAGAKAKLIQARYDRARVLTLMCLMTGEPLTLKDAP